MSEFEVWHGLANLYSSLSHWKDAEICLEKARALKPYSAAILHTEGKEQGHLFINWFFSKHIVKKSSQNTYELILSLFSFGFMKTFKRFEFLRRNIIGKRAKLVLNSSRYHLRLPLSI